MPKKLKPKQIAALQDEYLLKREALLVRKVDGIAVSLFDKVFNSYLAFLQQDNGKLANNLGNLGMIRGLDDIYARFNQEDNIPVVKAFIEDVQGTIPLNEKYFSALTKRDASQSTAKISGIMNRRLGVTDDGKLIPGGFADKFIADKRVLKQIKKVTTKAITKGMGFQEFRQEMKKTIQGTEGVAQSGGLQQYYRNYAYDTYIKVDRASADMYAKDMGLRYFYWVGGIITTTRIICDKFNGKIIDGWIWDKIISFTQIKPDYREGMDKNSVPKTDLGGYGCRHRKRYILTSVAMQNKDKIIDLSHYLVAA